MISGRSVKEAFSDVDSLVVTKTALLDARQLGFLRCDMVEAIQALEKTHFYKSMTSHADNNVWQDVYHVPFRNLVLYIKFTEDRITQFRLLSFKEK
jgi:motility quorum-sensing regulator/GCU-specific mRNA interferase toxin